uniref:Uncharacterized protein n=1 Tax=Trichogramma kaykai TaxID=54128 RepID=A0ABD2X8W7_9HYME
MVRNSHAVGYPLASAVGSNRLPPRVRSRVGASERFRRASPTPWYRLTSGRRSPHGSQPTSHPTFIHLHQFIELLTSGANSYVTLPLSEESQSLCHLFITSSSHLRRRLRMPDPSSATKSRSSRARPRLILYFVRRMRHRRSHGGEPARTCIATVGTV